MKKLLTTCCCLLLTATLSGCWSIQETPAISTLTPAPVPELTGAPVGEGALQSETLYPLYLPAANGERLVAQMAPVTLTFGTSNAEAVLRALFQFEENPTVQTITQGGLLKLASDDPVVVSGGIAVVKLTAASTNFQSQSLYNACASIAATLSQLEEITHVNVLLNNKAIGMDNRNILPLGTLTAQQGITLTKQWEAVKSQQVPLGYAPQDVPLYSAVTLFHPLADGSGTMPEVRTLAFPGQELGQQAAVLMEALHGGASTLQQQTAALSGVTLLACPPMVTTTALSTAERRVILHFVPDLVDRLQSAQVGFACYMGAVVQTLTTFIPSVSTVEVLLGDDPLAQLTHPALGTLYVADGHLTRDMVLPLLSRPLSLYVPVDGALQQQVFALTDSDGLSLRTMLDTLFRILSTADAAGQSFLPEVLSGADILGISVADGLLKVNLSDHAADVIRQLSPDEERLFLYAMVNSLHYPRSVRRVAFFFQGSQVETLAGHMGWSGTFLFAPLTTVQ